MSEKRRNHTAFTVDDETMRYIIDLAKREDRSNSKMISILVKEAIKARIQAEAREERQSTPEPLRPATV